MLGAQELWRASALPKVKFFFWLAIHGRRRLWTADRRKRHGLQDSDVCALCGQAPETTDHMLLSCVFAREVWWRTLRYVHLQHLAPAADDVGGSARALWSLVPAGCARSLDSLVLLVSWNLWKERNRRTFDAVRALPPGLLQLIAQEADEWLATGFSSLAILLAQESQIRAL